MRRMRRRPTRKASAEAEAKGAAAPAPRPAVIVPPTAMTGDKQVVDLGDGMEAQVLFLGRAHTGGDLSVYCRSRRSCS